MRAGWVWAALAAALTLAACGEEGETTTGAGGGGRGSGPARFDVAEEWVVGNVVFMLYHEVGHAMISEFRLPVLGREEDAADQFATVLLAPTADDPNEAATRHLLDAMDGWFRSSQQTALDEVAWWDEHGPDQQRGYGIACLLYGSDPDAFGTVADEIELPEARRETCAGDYATASRSWASLLGPHRLADGARAPHRVRVEYADASGFEAEAALLRESRVLDGVAEDMMSSFNLPRDLTIRASKCDDPNAYWDADTGTLELCYELLRQFAELHGGTTTVAEREADASEGEEATSDAPAQYEEVGEEASEEGGTYEGEPDEDPAPESMTQRKGG